MRFDMEPHEVNFFLPNESILTVRMFAVPDVGERIQIRGRDYRIETREWTIDRADDRMSKCARVSFALANFNSQ